MGRVCARGAAAGPFIHPASLADGAFGLVGLPSARAIADRFRTPGPRRCSPGWRPIHSWARRTVERLLWRHAGARRTRLDGRSRAAARNPSPTRCAPIWRVWAAREPSTRVESLAAIGNYDLTLCDVTPRQFLGMAGSGCPRRTGGNWKSTAMAPAFSKLTMPCRARSRGEPPSACVPQPCIWGDS